jgi:cytochrome c biogenesis protein CcdA
MLRLIGIVVSIGLADSLNPTTIAPALYMATGERSRERVIQFTIAVFAVYLVGGVAIALGPGQLLLSLVPHPSPTFRHYLELGVGLAMVVAALVLWRRRGRLAQRKLPDFDPHGRSSWWLGATITAVELPTAFPYFAAIAAVVGSGVGLPRQLILLVLFNVCFILPLLGIVATLTFGGERAYRWLAVGRRFLERYWPQVLAGLALVAGVFVIVLGATGLAEHSRGRFGREMRRLHHLIHP